MICFNWPKGVISLYNLRDRWIISASNHDRENAIMQQSQFPDPSFQVLCWCYQVINSRPCIPHLKCSSNIVRCALCSAHLSSNTAMICLTLYAKLKDSSIVSWYRSLKIKAIHWEFHREQITWVLQLSQNNLSIIPITFRKLLETMYPPDKQWAWNGIVWSSIVRNVEIHQVIFLRSLYSILKIHSPIQGISNLSTTFSYTNKLCLKTGMQPWISYWCEVDFRKSHS